MSKQQTAVDWLFEKYNFITWMRNRDEMSAETADILRAAFLKKANQMEKEQIKSSYNQGYRDADCDCYKSVGADVAKFEDSEKYYNETFGK